MPGGAAQSVNKFILGYITNKLNFYCILFSRTCDCTCTQKRIGSCYWCSVGDDDDAPAPVDVAPVVAFFSLSAAELEQLIICC